MNNTENKTMTENEIMTDKAAEVALKAWEAADAAAWEAADAANK